MICVSKLYTAFLSLELDTKQKCGNTKHRFSVGILFIISLCLLLVLNSGLLHYLVAQK